MNSENNVGKTFLAIGGCVAGIILLKIVLHVVTYVSLAHIAHP